MKMTPYRDIEARYVEAEEQLKEDIKEMVRRGKKIEEGRSREKLEIPDMKTYERIIRIYKGSL